MMVSPLNNCRISIVAGLRVATNNGHYEHATPLPSIKYSPELSSEVASSTMRRLGLQNATVVSFIWSERVVQARTISLAAELRLKCRQDQVGVVHH